MNLLVEKQGKEAEDTKKVGGEEEEEQTNKFKKGNTIRITLVQRRKKK